MFQILHQGKYTKDEHPEKNVFELKKVLLIQTKFSLMKTNLFLWVKANFFELTKLFNSKKFFL